MAEVRALHQLLDANAYAQQKNLPDLDRLLLGTGVRIGEALALRWADVDLVEGVVVVDATVVRVRGRGLVRKAGKTESNRVLTLPGWLVAMLARRFTVRTSPRPSFPMPARPQQRRRGSGHRADRIGV